MNRCYNAAGDQREALREELIQLLEKQGKLWRETEIKIQIGEPQVNEATKKIYICPFSGKVFGLDGHDIN